jgi:hypothetical protein
MKKSVLFLTFIFALCAGFTAQTTFSCSGASTVCSCGAGVKGEYYAGYFNDVQTYFTTNTVGLTRTDAAISFSTDNGWGAIVPPAGGSVANPDNYSTRWSGRISLAAGTYTFWLTSDDAAYFWLGTTALVANPTTASSFINNGGQHSPTTISAVGIFTSNCLQDFKVHFGENGGNNRAVLEYGSTGLGIARQIIPNTALCACMSLSSPLPIVLLDFTAEPTLNSVLLKWSTASEKNSELYIVERSADGLNWQAVATTKAAGESTQRLNYSILDSLPLTSVAYYRLKQIDFDQHFTYSPLVSVTMPRLNKTGFKVFPNPNHGSFYIAVKGVVTGMPITLTISDDFGKTLFTKDLIMGDPLAGPLLIQASNSVQSGTYNCLLDCGDEIFFSKILVE